MSPRTHARDTDPATAGKTVTTEPVDDTTVENTLEAPLAELVAHRREHGAIPNAMVERAAHELGITARQIRRRLKSLIAADGQSGPASRRAYQLDDDQLQVIFAHQGNVTAAYRDLSDGGHQLPAFTTFWRAWQAQPPDVRAFARDGADGMKRKWLYPPFEAPERNHVWQADHTELALDVVPNGTNQTIKPWLTIFVDDRTRLIMSWALTCEVGRRPDADTVVACMADGMRRRMLDGVEIGGVPGGIRWDQGAEFLAGQVTQLATEIGIDVHAVRPYSGHLTGKVERLWDTLERLVLARLPGFTHGALTYTRRDPYRQQPLAESTLRDLLATEIGNYNCRRGHKSLSGRTPLEAWASDPAPLRFVSDERLRSALLHEPRPRKVQKQGVHFRGRYWMGAGLRDAIDRRVNIRYSPTDESFIEVYLDGRWLCTCWPAERLPAEQRDRIEQDRRDAYRTARELQDGAARRRIEAAQHLDENPRLEPISHTSATDPLEPDIDDLLAMLGHQREPDNAAAQQDDQEQEDQEQEDQEQDEREGQQQQQQEQEDDQDGQAGAAA